MKQNLNSLVIISARIVKMEKVAFKNYGSILFIMGKYKNIIFVYAKFSRNIFHSIRFSRALVC